MNELQQVRTLEDVAKEIRGYTAVMLTNIIEIGRRMLEAKEMLPYGEFGSWIRDNTGYSSSTANNFMRLYQEYGAAQGSLFGAEVDCQTFGKLSYSKALALLALPSGERESFVQENDVDAMSTRELQQAIAEKKAAEEREAALQKEFDLLKQAHEQDAKDVEDLERLHAEAEAKAKKWEETAGSYASQANDLQNDLRDAQKQIRELETRPQPVAFQRDEKAIEEAVQQAKAAAAAEWSEKTKKLADKLNEATAKAEKLKAKADRASSGADEKIAAAEKETARIRQELEVTQKKLKASNGNVAAFGVYFKSVQENFNAMMEKVREIGEEDPETAKKLCGAARVILNKAIERLGEG